MDTSRKESLAFIEACIDNHMDSVIYWGAGAIEIDKNIRDLQRIITKQKEKLKHPEKFKYANLARERKVHLVKEFCKNNNLKFYGAYHYQGIVGTEINIEATATSAKLLDDFLTAEGILHVKPHVWGCINQTICHIY